MRAAPYHRLFDRFQQQWGWNALHFGGISARNMRYLINQFTKLCLTFVVLIAMTGSGFAHRVAAPDLDESLLAYVQAGGALEDICGGAGSGEGNSQACDACRLVDGAVVPFIEKAATSQISSSAFQTQIVSQFVVIAQTINPSCPARAPPAV